jgi:Na+/H+-dicarboxylate symporter
MILAVDEIMDMARTTINVVGNGLASVVIARWEGVLGEEGSHHADEALVASPEPPG